MPSSSSSDSSFHTKLRTRNYRNRSPSPHDVKKSSRTSSNKRRTLPRSYRRGSSKSSHYRSSETPSPKGRVSPKQERRKLSERSSSSPSSKHSDYAQKKERRKLTEKSSSENKERKHEQRKMTVSHSSAESSHNKGLVPQETHLSALSNLPIIAASTSTTSTTTQPVASLINAPAFLPNISLSSILPNNSVINLIPFGQTTASGCTVPLYIPSIVNPSAMSAEINNSQIHRGMGNPRARTFQNPNRGSSAPYYIPSRGRGRGSYYHRPPRTNQYRYRPRSRPQSTRRIQDDMDFLIDDHYDEYNEDLNLEDVEDPIYQDDDFDDEEEEFEEIQNISRTHTQHRSRSPRRFQRTTRARRPRGTFRGTARTQYPTENAEHETLRSRVTQRSFNYRMRRPNSSYHHIPNFRRRGRL